MAIPYFVKSGDYVYFRNGMMVPYPLNYDRPQSIGRTEDGFIKVYDHSLGGTYKRTWRVKAIMDNGDSANYKFSDLLAFITSTIVHAKYQFSYYDKDGTVHTVRLMGWSNRIKHSGIWEVTLILEEDYT